MVPADGLFIDTSIGYLDTKVKNPTNSPLIGTRLPLAPSWTANLAVRKDIELANGSLFSLGVDGQYSASRTFDLANAAGDGAYVIANAQASYQFGLDRRFNVAAWGKNLFNRVYFLQRQLNGSQVGPDNALPSDPVTYGVTMTANF